MGELAEILQGGLQLISGGTGGGSGALRQIPVAGDVVADSPVGDVIDQITDVAIPLITGGAGTALTVDPSTVGRQSMPQGLEGFTGGNGRFSKRTIVQTLDRTNLTIVGFEVLAGAPHLMNRDISAAKKVFRQVRKLDQRLPKKTVKQSKTKQVTEAVQDAALRQIECGGNSSPCCPRS